MPFWRLTHISDEVIPALKANGVSDDELNQMFVQNPKRFFEQQGAY
jgi:phosphotriesterase-related protein